MRRQSRKGLRGSTPRCGRPIAGPKGRSDGADPRSLITPETWVRDYIQAQRNHYPELEEASETLGGALAHPLSVAEPLRQRLKEAWGVEVRVVEPEVLEDASQNYDPQRRVLMLSSLLRPENRTFGIAYQLALLEFAPIIARMLEAARAPDPGSRRLLHMSFANYAAGAIIMPYGKFLRAAEEHRYNLDRLTAQFGANVEQVSHRLTTLSRPNAKGVPFFMLRVDPAGNISKRYAGESFPFSHFGGTCPRWHLHTAFQTPGQTIRQLIETPDGQRFFTDQPDDRAAHPPGPARRCAAGDRARLRREARAPHRLCRRFGAREDGCDAGRARLRDLPAPAMRLSRDAAGWPDAGGRGES